MNPNFVPALIAGAVSLAVAVLSHWLGPRSQRSLERLKAELNSETERLKKDLERQSDVHRNEFERYLEEFKGAVADRNSATAARRDYEYEARKRLYAEVEPILFQLYEALEEAHYRVLSLARSSRAGRLGNNPQNWLATNNYYLRSTLYKLVLPTAYLRLMQRRITFVDLGLDPTIRLRYLLLKLYSRSFTDDFIFASMQPTLEYDPNNEQWAQLREKQPQVYARQALVLGDLENIADSLLKEDGDIVRTMVFAEFEELLQRRSSEDDSLQELVRLFLSFSPGERPVLARMLITQACLAKMILSTYHRKTEATDLVNRLDEIVRSSELRKALSWTETEAAADTMRPTEEYLRERLEWLRTAPDING